VINVLRGSESEKILDYAHNRCKTYGVGRDWSAKQWQNLVHQLVAHNLLTKNDDYGVLSLTQGSYELLSGKYPFQGHVLQEDNSPSKIVKFRQSESYDTSLFERLRSKRKELADRMGVPPYVVFSDKSLIDMCHRRPKTKAEFSEVFGVGDQKLAKFSTVFMEVINS
jgi:ATP-dependent DNA helicase RecQ